MASSPAVAAVTAEFEISDRRYSDNGLGMLWMGKLRKIIDILLIGFSDDKMDNHGRNSHSGNSRHFSSIEVDPECEGHCRAGTSSDRSVVTSKEDGFFSFRRLRQCLTMKRYAFLVTCIELLGLLYLMSTSLVIYTRDPIWAWFFQPFIAPLWFRHPVALLSTMCTFCIAGFAGVICLMQALDNKKGWPQLMIPHLLLQMLTIFATLIFTIIAVVLLMTKGTFALRILELAGSTLSNGIVGIGNIVLGLEHGRLSSAIADDILLGAGITPVSVVDAGLRTNVTATMAPSVVHYNVIGAIWEAFNYEIAMVVALMVFGTICVTEIFAWLLIRQLYASHITNNKACYENGSFGAAPLNIRGRRRYCSGDLPVPY